MTPDLLRGPKKAVIAHAIVLWNEEQTLKTGPGVPPDVPLDVHGVQDDGDLGLVHSVGSPREQGDGDLGVVHSVGSPREQDDGDLGVVQGNGDLN